MATNFTLNAISSIRLKEQDYHLKNIAFHGTAAEWANHADYVPKAGEIVIYDADSTNELRIKIGDGTTTVSALSFSLDNQAIKAYADQKVAELVDDAPDTLNTLRELADALEENADIIDVLNTAITDKVDRGIYNEKIAEIEIAINEKAEAQALEDLEDRVISLTESTAANFEADRRIIDDLGTKQDEIEISIADLQSDKVNTAPGMGLSSNDYTTTEKNKLANIAENANNYSLPTAGSIEYYNPYGEFDKETGKDYEDPIDTGEIGGVKVGKNITNTNGLIGITALNVQKALGYVPAKNVNIDTSLSMSGAAADAKTVGDLIDNLDQVIALDENSDGNVILQSYIIADEEEEGTAAGRLDSSLTQAGVAPDSKAVGDAINLRMLANAVIPVAQGGSGKTTAVESFKVLQSRGLLTGDMNSMMNVGAGWVQLASCTNTPYGNNPTDKNGYLEIIEPESGEILQRYTNHLDGMVWLRSYANNSWTAWFEGGASSAIIPISQGGTGATTAEEGLLNLGGFPNCKPVRTTDTDLNDYKTEGWYFFTTSYTPINIPGGGNGWLCVLSNNDQAFVKQIFYRAGTPGTNDYMAWTRTYTSAAGWSTWAQIYTSKNDAFMGPDSTSQRSLQSAPVASSGAGLWVYGLDHANSGQFRLQTYNADTSTYYQLRGTPAGALTWNGTLNLTNTTDGSSTADNNAALIIGARTGSHIVIDNNEIIAKASGTTGGDLFLGDNQSSVYIYSSKLLLRSGYSYGTSLPAAGTAGRIFFKKV